MKKVLSLLVVFVFLQVQTWALSGGPDYSRGKGGISPNALVGTYSGVLIPEDRSSEGDRVASIGLFSVTIPSTGLAEGTAILFVNGTAFTGNMLALGDPDKLSLTGIFSGQSNYEVITVPQSVFTDANGNTIKIDQVTAPVVAQGSIKAKILPGAANAFSGGQGGTTTRSGFFTSVTTTTDVGTNEGARVNGTAEIETFFQVDANGKPIPSSFTQFSIDGFKQGNTVSKTTTNFSDFFF